MNNNIVIYLLVAGVISLNTSYSSASFDKQALLSESQIVNFDMARHGRLSDLSANVLKQYDDLFAELKESWILFKSKEFRQSFQELYIDALNNGNAKAQYLLGEIYEKGFRNECAPSNDPSIWYNKESSCWYTIAITNSNDPILIQMAHAGLDRIIGNKRPLYCNEYQVVGHNSQPSTMGVGQSISIDTVTSNVVQNGVRHRKGIHLKEH